MEPFLDALVGAIMWVAHQPIPEPVYDSSVRAPASVTPKVIVAVLGLLWLAAQAPAIAARFF